MRSGCADARLTFGVNRRSPCLAGILLGMAASVVMQTLVATALPAIAGELGGMSLYSWVFAAYMLASTITIPLSAKLADVLGPGRDGRIGTPRGQGQATSHPSGQRRRFVERNRGNSVRLWQTNSLEGGINVQATTQSIVTAAQVALGALAAGVVISVLTRVRFPVIGTDRAALIALVVLGLTMCALGGTRAAVYPPPNPFTLVGIVLGIVALLVAAAGLFRFQLPLMAGERDAIIALAAIMAVKVLVALARDAVS